jgi:hypothetical protein
MFGSLIQNSIRRSSSTSVVYRIIHLVSNWWYILVLYRLIAPISTLTGFWFVAAAGHLTSGLTLTGGRRDSVGGVALINVLGTAQIVIAGCTVSIDGMITRL